MGGTAVPDHPRQKKKKKGKTLSKKYLKAKIARGMAQVVAHLPVLPKKERRN
jgi:hypothetical protein